MDSKESALDNGLVFINNCIQPNGMVRCFARSTSIKDSNYEDLVTYFSGLTGLILLELGSPIAQQMSERLMKFVKDEMLESHLWMWSAIGSDLRKYIPPDIDTTSINAELIMRYGIDFKGDNILLKNTPNRKKMGFYTWIVPRLKLKGVNFADILSIVRHSFYSLYFWRLTGCFPNQFADISSTNAFYLLMQKDSDLIKDAEVFLSRFQDIDSMNDFSYRNIFIKRFFVSRILRFSDNKILRERFSPSCSAIEHLSDLELSCLILTSSNFSQPIPSGWREELKSRQQKNGNWSENDVFCYGGIFEWNCPGLNTALALAAINDVKF